jgi:DNA-directed RNA polymerase subunit RPC12/RpoP
MTVKVQCQHCQGDFEDEGHERTVFCPSCGKETTVLAKGYNFTPTIKDDYSGAIIGGYVCAVLIPFVGFLSAFI